MTMHLGLPGQLNQNEPGKPFEPPKSYVFDHVPNLRELLPKFRGLPGFEYLQCCVSDLRRAQDEGWTEVENTYVYTIKGSKGEVDMKLLARGQRTPGQPHDAGARLCSVDLAVEILTGLRVNPNRHLEPEIGEGDLEGSTLSSVDAEDTRGPVYQSGGPKDAAQP